VEEIAREDNMPEIPVSVFIITKNEEVRIGRVIEALRGWIADIVVVDSGSTDRTVEIAQSLGAQVYHNPWAGYGPQKCFAERQCRHDWLLNLDADEVVTPELAKEIQALFAAGVPPPGAYKMRVLTVYPGDEKPRPWANDYNIVRLYHRSAGGYSDHPVFDRVILKDATSKQLNAAVYHYSHISFTHLIDKLNTFSSFRAEKTKKRSQLLMKIRVFIEFPLNFVKYYIFRRHFAGGWKGFYFSLCHAFMRTTRVAKMLETQKNP
jgi:glycosyltransferase involved in cell wall biosynthesis